MNVILKDVTSSKRFMQKSSVNVFDDDDEDENNEIKFVQGLERS